MKVTNRLVRDVYQKRMRLGLTQADLGTMLGVSDQTIYALEGGRRQHVQGRVARAITKFLCHPDDNKPVEYTVPEKLLASADQTPKVDQKQVVTSSKTLVINGVEYISRTALEEFLTAP